MSDLLELAERCEQAPGPDGVLDRAIAAAIHVNVITHHVGEWATDPPFSKSVDAAMTLVPEGLVWSGHFDPRGSRACVLGQDGFNQHHTIAETPALALCAAALRARAALHQEHGSGE